MQALVSFRHYLVFNNSRYLNMKKIIALIILAAFIAIPIILLTKKNGPVPSSKQISKNITIEDGKQVITIDAKGGYTPRKTDANANTPTLLKIKTSSTFDCSSALVIPSLNYRKNLPPSGETVIEVPPQKPGTNIRGLCSMGMFSFNIMFN